MSGSGESRTDETQSVSRSKSSVISPVTNCLSGPGDESVIDGSGIDQDKTERETHVKINKTGSRFDTHEKWIDVAENHRLDWKGQQGQHTSNLRDCPWHMITRSHRLSSSNMQIKQSEMAR